MLPVVSSADWICETKSEITRTIKKNIISDSCFSAITQFPLLLKLLESYFSNTYNGE